MCDLANDKTDDPRRETRDNLNFSNRPVRTRMPGGVAWEQSKMTTPYADQEPNMPTIKIDDKEYDLDTLSDEAKKQLQMLQYVDGELARLQAQGAVLQTARIAYVNALKAALPSPFVGDTIKPPG